MKNFDLQQATQPADALKLIQQAPATQFIAGGTNLVDLMKYRVENPDALVDISRLSLDKVEKTASGLRIGALARNSDVAANKLVTDQFPLLSQALLAGASPQLRNMATMGGKPDAANPLLLFLRYQHALQQTGTERKGRTERLRGHWWS